MTWHHELILLTLVRLQAMRKVLQGGLFMRRYMSCGLLQSLPRITFLNASELQTILKKSFFHRKIKAFSPRLDIRRMTGDNEV